jgi:hypothetical protein
MQYNALLLTTVFTVGQKEIDRIDRVG